jgi:hypothetical protein
MGRDTMDKASIAVYEAVRKLKTEYKDTVMAEFPMTF